MLREGTFKDQLKAIVLDQNRLDAERKAREKEEAELRKQAKTAGLPTDLMSITNARLQLLLKGITMSLVWVTPDMARTWLTLNRANRKIRMPWVQQLISLLKEGNFGLSNDAVCFAPDGTLLNGQHRLQAGMLAGVPAPLIVVRGMPPEMQRIIDRGKVRSVSDALQLEGIMVITPKQLQIVRALKFEGQTSKTGEPFEPDNVRTFVAKHINAINFILSTFGKDVLKSKHTSALIAAPILAACVRASYAMTASRMKTFIDIYTGREDAKHQGDIAAKLLRNHIIGQNRSEAKKKIGGGEPLRANRYRKAELALSAFVRKEALTALPDAPNTGWKELFVLPDNP